jgi:sugar lactone lactonase YvrE
MKPHDISRRALSIIAVALLAGCGGSQPPIAAPGAMPQNQTSATYTHGERGGSWMLPEAKSNALLYVVNFDPAYNDVTIYHAKATHPSPIGTIADGLFEPAGDCIDRYGTLYVTNIPGSSLGWVSVYPIGQTKPSRMIRDGINIPIFCAIDANGNLWVANLGGRNVTEYDAGSSTPGTVITNGVPNPTGIAIDHSGNTYVSNDSGGSHPVSNVVVYAFGAKSPKRTITDGVQSPAGIAVDSSGTLYVTNFSQNNVEKYHPGKQHPYAKIANGISEPIAVTIGKNGWLYVTNDGKPSPAIVEFAPDSLTPSTRKITKGLEGPEGSAYYPPLLP